MRLDVNLDVLGYIKSSLYVIVTILVLCIMMFIIISIVWRTLSRMREDTLNYQALGLDNLQSIRRTLRRNSARVSPSDFGRVYSV